MRTENVPQIAGESDVKETAAGPMPETSTPAATAVMSKPKAMGKLTAMMALEEPARTEALEKAVTAGLTVYLRSTTGGEVRWRYGDHVLVVPETPKPFAAAHAIHLLFYASNQIEEVEG
ncbi:MAG: hypothetical protein ACE149_20015 [Armatimonadota bacterium]